MTPEDEAALAEIRARSAKLKLWVVTTRTIADKAAMRAVLLDHLRHLTALEKQGVLSAPARWRTSMALRPASAW